jgi:hypothetical protein
MAGVIRKKEVICNSFTVVRLYGWRVYVRCLFARKGTTFLAIVFS